MTSEFTISITANPKRWDGFKAVGITNEGLSACLSDENEDKYSD
jgi:hypothetical protein